MSEICNTLLLYIVQLNKKRSTNYSKDWFTVGYVIHKLTYGNNDRIQEKGLELWHIFSKADPKYNYIKIQKKWKSFEKVRYPLGLKKIAEMVVQDGGSIYDDGHELFIEKKERLHIFNNIVPKLSIRRMRNYYLLEKLCSAMYHMSNHYEFENGEEDMFKVSKRIKDQKLKEYFIKTWKKRSFIVVCGVDDIMEWFNDDNHQKMLNKIKRERYM